MSGALWSQLIGHDAVLAALSRGVARERGAQGYLFAGPDGVGKTTAALGLAQRLNCTADTPPCGACRECRAIADGYDPDVRVIEPELMGGSGPFRPKFHPIKAVRDVVHEASLRPVGRGWRVIILPNAEALREDAANTFLKTLEEPPAKLVFVLTSEQPGALLPTITSRLRRLDFGLVATAAIAAWLEDAHGVSAEEAAIDAALSGGRPGRALALATNPGIQAFRRELLARAAKLGTEPAVACLSTVAWLLEGDDEGTSGERVAWALELLEWWVRDALVLVATGRREALVHRDWAAPLAAFAARRDAARLRDGLAALSQARLALSRNANAELTLQVLWLRLAAGSLALGRA